MRLGKYDIQTRLTKELCQQLEINDNRPFTYRDISKVEKLLKIQIKVVNADNCCEIDYTRTENKYKVYLLKKDDHFYSIFSMSAFRERVYYCELCDTGYNNKKKHSCKKGQGQKCRLCNEKYHIQNFVSKKIYCHECNRYCVNNDCLRKHKDVCDKEY
ncbi:unnamed protein product [Macrosiphum euphorbiae]|uniref:Uncharacterized protein n=1 Tax=Macrosiphum euphorbiae TaxID=13131 RepID=A0AAV0W6T9_9HEMI|nr:unnamed protein product [Macrosiphum euphorbiae]